MSDVLSGLCSDELHEGCNGSVMIWACGCECHGDPETASEANAATKDLIKAQIQNVRRLQ